MSIFLKSSEKAADSVQKFDCLTVRTLKYSKVSFRLNLPIPFCILNGYLQLERLPTIWTTYAENLIVSDSFFVVKTRLFCLKYFFSKNLKYDKILNILLCVFQYGVPS